MTAGIPMAPLVETARSVVAVLRAARVDLTNEKRAQADLAAALAAAGHGCAREVRLAPGDIVDLMVDDAIAVEVKLNRARRAEIGRQLARYARHDRVAALVLATNRAVGLAASIEGKPSWEVSLGRAWL